MDRPIYPGAFDSALYDLVASANDNVYLFLFNKFGYNSNISTSAAEDLWDVGGRYEYAQAADVLRIASDSADDAPAGNGVNTVSIYGLDENWNLQREEVELNGTTPVFTVGSYIRVYRMRCILSSSGDPNANAIGNLSAFNDSEDILQAYVTAGNSSTKMSHFSIPAGYTGFISNIAITGGPNDDFIADLKLRNNGNIFYTAADVEISNSNTYIDRFMPNIGPLVEMSDVKFDAIGVSNNASGRVTYIVRIIENGYLERLTRSLG